MTALVSTLGTYPVGPVALDSGSATLIADVEAALNGANPMFAGLFSAGLVGEQLTITSKCTPLALLKIVTDQANEDFSQQACDPTIVIDITIDCDNIECLTFKDITKQYNASTNPTGYGGENWPAISDILSVNFTVFDADDNDYTWENAPYIPSADGTASICIKGSDLYGGISLGYLIFEPGATYRIVYTLNLIGDEQLSTEQQSFVFPCCGKAITSNLTTNFSVTEKIGCGSIDFKDTTGTYDADNNPGGYGTPNPGYDDISSTIINITLADGSVKTITDFIPTADNQVKNINAATLGFPDGVLIPQIFTIEYSVFTGETQCRIGYKKVKSFFRCALWNCISSRGQAFASSSCNGPCDDREKDIVLNLLHRYDMMVLASANGIDCIATELADLWNECKKHCTSC